MLDELKQRIAEFERLQRTYQDYGAYDTEPDGVFQRQLVRAVLGKTVTVPSGRGEWQLYRGKRGIREVVQQLHDACQKVVECIQKTPNKEKDRVRAYLEDYCWRITWDA